ncbi:AAA family ATPase [Dyella telluris]|uniref:AAA family ATPase n=1 Tax=Dyella telluris TaxID=2763498 RepID=A0A7G8Q2H1_9GAMM|nr:AAA family ATPase [Dyella telluris]QNK00979.1 AAA family ATPase [Dyella telluris]
MASEVNPHISRIEAQADNELERVIKATGGAANDATGNNVRRLFTLTRADRIERKATDWLIRDYLVRDTLAALIAKPGACKSFLAVDWACRIATGTSWYGREVKPGAVFYLAGEGQRGLRKRIDGWEKHNGVSLEGAPLFIASGMPFLCDQLNVASTLAIIKETAEELRESTGIKPAMIVIDTVARAMNGANENATDDMGKFVSACDQLRQEWGCIVLAVHHTGNDPGAQDRGRGNSNFGASMDSDFYLKPKDGGLELKSGDKAKDWRKPPTLLLSKVEIEVESIGDDGEPVRETTLALHDAAGAVADTSKREQVERLHQDGMTVRAIAEQTGVPRSTAQRWLKPAA